MTAISSTVIFAHANIPNVDADDEAQWVFGLGPQNPPLTTLGPIKNTFIYAMQVVDGGSPTLFAEYGADGSGKLSKCDGDVRRANTDDSTLPELVALGTEVECLLDNANGKSVEYFFFGSRVRLSMSAINNLATNKPKCLPLLSIEADNACHIDDAGTKFAPVIDPLFVASELNLHYQEAANALINSTTLHSELPSGLRDQLEERQNILLLAKLLQALMAHPDASKFKSCFRDGTGQIVTTHIQTREKEVNNLIMERDRRGATLCRFLRSELMEFTELLYKVQEAEHYAEFLRGMSHACKRLCECPNGRARLADWDKNPPHWLSAYVFPEASTSGIEQVVRKGIAASASLWEDFAPVWVLRFKDKFPEEFNRAVNKLTKAEWVSFEQITSTVNVGNGVQVPIVTRGYMQIEVPPNLKSRLASAMSGAEALDTAVERVGKMVEVANLSLAAAALSDTLDATNSVLGFSDKSAAFLNAIGAGFDTIDAFAAFGKLGKVGLRRVAMVSAVIDTYLALRDAKNAYDRADNSSMIGFTVVATGSALLFLGTVFAGKAAVAGAAGALTFGLVASVVGAIVVAAGYVIVVLLTDSPMETYIKHCYFGLPNVSGKAQDPWSVTEYSEWRKGVAGARAQVKALYNLLAAFTVTPMFDQAVRIKPGLLTPGSQFKIQAEVVGTGLKDLDLLRQYALEVDVAAKTMKSVGVHPADTKSVAFITDREGRLSIEVEFDAAKGSAPLGAFMSVSRSEAMISLDLFGNGKVSVPHGTSAEINVMQRTTISSSSF